MGTIVVDVTENFNKSSKLPDEAFIEQNIKLLDSDQADLFQDFREGIKRDMLQTLDDDRPGRIAGFATRLAMNRGPELGTERLGRPILPGEVLMMMSRAEHEGLPLDQLTPHSLAEQHIITGYKQTEEFERNACDHWEHTERPSLERKYLGNLLGLEQAGAAQSQDLSQAKDDRTWGEDGRTLSTEFDKHR